MCGLGRFYNKKPKYNNKFGEWGIDQTRNSYFPDNIAGCMVNTLIKPGKCRKVKIYIENC